MRDPPLLCYAPLCLHAMILVLQSLPLLLPILEYCIVYYRGTLIEVPPPEREMRDREREVRSGEVAHIRKCARRGAERADN